MIERIRIEIQDGARVKSTVDHFYQKNGSQGRARPDDLFFLALQGDQLLGCVRFCVEEKTPLLRTMMVDESSRRKGIGQLLLQAFEEHLEQNDIRNVYCIPFAHLDRFYGSIGFEVLNLSEAPAFLHERIQTYREGGKKYLCMRRP